MIKGHLDLLLGGHELIEGAVPGLELLEVDPELACAGASWARTGGPGDRRGSQSPASRPGDVAGGADEPIGDQDDARSANGTPWPYRRTSRMVHSPELVGQADGEDRPPGGGVEDVGVFGLTDVARSPPRNRWNLGRISTKRSLRRGRRGCVLDLAVVAIGLTRRTYSLIEPLEDWTLMVLRYMS